MIDLTAEHLISLRALVTRKQTDQNATALPGGLVTRRRGRGLETADLRAFAHGDDPRHIDRNATARLGQPHVRTFHAEQDRTTVLLADFRPSMFWGTRRTLRSVAAAEALSLVGWRAVQTGARVGVIALTADAPDFAPPRGRDRGMIRAIGCMVSAHVRGGRQTRNPDPDLDRFLSMAHRLCPRGAKVILASGFDAPGSNFADAAKLLARRRSLSFIRIADALETNPQPGNYWLRHPDGSVRQARIGKSLPDTETWSLADMPMTTYAVDQSPARQAHIA